MVSDTDRGIGLEMSLRSAEPNRCWYCDVCGQCNRVHGLGRCRSAALCLNALAGERLLPCAKTNLPGLLWCSKLMFSPAAQHIQIIGMSATSECGQCRVFST